MRQYRWIQSISLAFVVVVGSVQATPTLYGGQAAAVADSIVLAKPERVGLATEVVDELDAAMQGIVDKPNDLVFIGMIQRRGGAPGAANHEELARAITYKALVVPGASRQ